MPAVGKLLDFLGGALGRVAITGISLGLFAFLAGMTPPEFVASVLEDPPAWANSPWFRWGFIIGGLVVGGLESPSIGRGATQPFGNADGG